MDIFSATNRINDDFFPTSDGSLGKIVKTEKYQTAEIVILGCSKATETTDKIRREFYNLSDFGINRKVFDLGNFKFAGDSDANAENYQSLVNQILQDRKRLIFLGGETNSAYFNGQILTETFGKEWLGVNISSNFGTAYRQLLEENFIVPNYFYEVGFQNHLNSSEYHKKLQDSGANLISLEQLRSQETVDVRLREMMREQFIHHTTTLNTMFSFDLRAVRASDAPGSTAPGPIGLRAGEFLKLVEFAKSLANTKIIEFTEFNPNNDVAGITAKLIAVALHRICSK